MNFIKTAMQTKGVDLGPNIETKIADGDGIADDVSGGGNDSSGGGAKGIDNADDSPE